MALDWMLEPPRRFRRASSTDGTDVRLMFWCPGCDMPHGPRIAGPGAWTFNGDWECPTLSPSILVHVDGRDGTSKCHSFLEAGRIRFLDDCWHALKGQTVDVPVWPARW